MAKTASKTTLTYWTKQLMEFYRSQKFTIDPEPKITFVDTPNDTSNLLIPTGHYDFDAREITVYTSNRHLKDILRTIAHELVHHHQYLVDKMNFITTNKNGKLKDNPALRKLEGEAYLYGNLYFRMFTETMSN